MYNQKRKKKKEGEGGGALLTINKSAPPPVYNLMLFTPTKLQCCLLRVHIFDLLFLVERANYVLLFA